MSIVCCINALYQIFKAFYLAEMPLHFATCSPGVWMRGDTLEEGEGVADPVGLVGGQHGRVDGRIDVDDLLQQRCHRPEAVPEHRGEVTDHLPLLAQLQQRRLPRVGAAELNDPLVNLLPEIWTDGVREAERLVTESHLSTLLPVTAAVVPAGAELVELGAVDTGELEVTADIWAVEESWSEASRGIGERNLWSLDQNKAHCILRNFVV